MNIMKRITSRFGLVLLLILPLMAIADPLQIFNSHDIFTPPLTDKSINYLGQIFGTVGTVIHGTSGQLLGKLFYVFNYAMVMIASCILVYTVFMSIINTAQEGEFMGRNMNAAWTAIRAVTGIGILVPKYTGYSLIQVFILWMTVQGVGLADKAWSHVIDYLTIHGGVIYADPSETVKGSKNSNTNGADKGMVATYNDAVLPIFNSQLCMYALQEKAQQEREKVLEQLKNNPTNPELLKKAKMPYPQYRPIWNAETKTVSFGYLPQGEKPSSDPTKPSTDNICGAYSWKVNSGRNELLPGSDGATVNDLFENYKRTAIEQIVLNTAIPARAMLSVQGKLTGNRLILERTRLVENLVGATADYENIMQPALRVQQDDVVKGWRKSLVESKESGWILAGSYYWDLAKVNNQLGNVMSDYRPAGVAQINSQKLEDMGIKSRYEQLQKYSEDIGRIKDIPTFLETLQQKMPNALPNQMVNYVKELSNSVDSAKDVLNKVVSGKKLGKDEQKNVLGTTTTVLSSAALAGTGTATSLALFLTGNIGPWAIMTNFMVHVMALWSAWFGIMNHGGDPVSMIQRLGVSMTTIAFTFWLSSMILVGGIMKWLGLCQGQSSLVPSWEAAMKLMLPAMLAFIGTIFVNGLILSTYVPLIPYMIFTFAAIGWMISVLEAVVAGPLVAAAITRPEGHDLLGKAEQAIMLLMGVFLRPVVMIIGYFAAIIIARVALRLVNAGFAHVVDTSSSWYGVNIFAVVAVIIIYTMMVLSIINMVFNAGIVKLWETIWMWIGFHQPQTAAQEALQKVEHGVQSAGGAGEQFGTSMMRGAGDSRAAKLADVQAGRDSDYRLGGVGADGKQENAVVPKVNEGKSK